MSPFDKKDNFISIVWMLIFFGIGCSDIIYSLAVGDFYYDDENSNFSPSLWLLIIGVFVTLCSPIYPVYAITKDIFQAAIFCAILFPFLAGTCVVRITIGRAHG